MDTREFIRIMNDMIAKKQKVAFTLGKIDPLYSGGLPKIVFDGEDAPSTKRYGHLSSYQPKAGDRVLLANVSGSHVVLGHIGAFRGATGTASSGGDGVGLLFNWNGTSLGIRREDENSFTYVDLKGSDGVDGVDGTNGINGTNGTNGVGLLYNWSGTSLGVKRENEANYTYVDLKGDKGDKGDNGDPTLSARETAWVQPTLSSGWVQYGGGYDHCKYKRDISNMVHIKGMIKTGTVGTLFTLPVGFRPPTTVICIAHCRGLNTAPQNVEIRITNTGVVSVQNMPDNNWLSLHGVYFSTEL